MEANQLLTADVLDIIFIGKNKAYGAYQLRKTYNRRLNLSMLLLGGLLSLLVICYFLPKKKTGFYSSPIIEGTVILTPLPEKEVIKKPISIPKPPAPIKTTQYVTIRIVADDQVKGQDKPPIVDELVNAKIGTVTQEGEDYTTLQGPNTLSDGIGKGIIDAPVAGNGSTDGGFIPVEIESMYPGGDKAWLRFLNRMLGNNYPPEAVENNVQGTVVIEFIVDVDGSVSNVKAISGPEELWDAAIRTIKKSGKWIPAKQNGISVKTCKRQPIKFMLEQE